MSILNLLMLLEACVSTKFFPCSTQKILHQFSEVFAFVCKWCTFHYLEVFVFVASGVCCTVYKCLCLLWVVYVALHQFLTSAQIHLRGHVLFKTNCQFLCTLHLHESLSTWYSIHYQNPRQRIQGPFFSLILYCILWVHIGRYEMLKKSCSLFFPVYSTATAIHIVKVNTLHFEKHHRHWLLFSQLNETVSCTVLLPASEPITAMIWYDVAQNITSATFRDSSLIRAH